MTRLPDRLRRLNPLRVRPDRRLGVAGKMTIALLLLCVVAASSALFGQRALTARGTQTGLDVAPALTVTATALTRVQAERAAAVPAPGAAAGRLTETRLATDRAVLDLAATPWPESALGAARDAIGRVNGLGRLRSAIDLHQDDAAQAVDAYGAVATGLEGLVSALAAGDPTSTSAAFAGLATAQEEVAELVSRIELVRTQPGLAAGQRGPIASEQARLLDTVREIGNLPGMRALLDSPAFSSLSALSQSFGSGVDIGAATDPTMLESWAASASAFGAGLAKLAGSSAAAITDDTASAESAALEEAVLNGVLALLLGLATVLLGAFVVRGAARSVRVVRDQAVRMLEQDLVSSVTDVDSRAAAIQESGGDELKQVSLLLETMRDQAFHLVDNERVVRNGNIGVLVNLSRRCQTLIGTQLGILEDWEQGVSDPTDLGNLFKLDHLATRMRRVNENLILLSGQEATSRARRPAALEDILQAALGEIDKYSQVRLTRTPAVKINAGLIKDLIRLLAELLENATAFSPPEAEVVVDCRILDDGSLSISILDAGIGMSDDVAEQANSRLTRVGPLDLVGAQTLGLFVVGRLAGRHGLAVVLHAGSEVTGVRAMITVPAANILEAEAAKTRLLPTRVPGATPGLEAEVSAVAAGEAQAQEPGLPARAVRSTPPSRRNGRRPSPFFSRSSSPAVEPAGKPLKRPAPPAPTSVGKKPGWFSGTASRARGPASEDWSSAADSEWKIVETVSQREPEKLDESGLPQRVQGEHLLPGSIGSSDFLAASTAADRPDPLEMRRRLEAFRAGLDRQRGDRTPAAPVAAAPRTPVLRTPAPKPAAAKPAARPFMATPKPAARPLMAPPPMEVRTPGGSPLPPKPEPPRVMPLQKRRTNGDSLPLPPKPETTASRTRSGTSPSKESSEWTMLSDNGWKQARHVAGITSEISSETGLPQRVQGEHLLPGSARANLAPSSQRVRDPEEIRHRIGSFRRGLETARSEQH
jgi:signal transduction histidine kinase